VELIANYQYSDPDHTLLEPHLVYASADDGNEQYRVATQTMTEDALAPGIGADAVIHAGGAMSIGMDNLLNQPTLPSNSLYRPAC
jgi:filamentous hemagglutinin